MIQLFKIMHQLGFWHEHERNDRDYYIDADWIASPGVWSSTCPIEICSEFNKFPYVKGYKRSFRINRGLIC